MKILTCNIRYSGAEDGQNNWEHRKEICGDVIKSQSPDIICFQEMWADQFAYLSSALSNFESYAMVDEPVGHHPQNCIFYRSDGFNMISAGGFWLSETPHIAGSKSWDSECVRLANWVRLKDRTTGIELRVVNTHLDHISQVAREQQAQLIVDDTAAYPEDYPQILTGDMNCDFRNKAIDILKAGGWVDTYGILYGTEDPGYTYHEFLGSKYNSDIGKMDWIFTKGKTKVIDAVVIKDCLDERYPSDHYFVSASVVVRTSDDIGKPDHRTDS